MDSSLKERAKTNRLAWESLRKGGLNAKAIRDETVKMIKVIEQTVRSLTIHSRLELFQQQEATIIQIKSNLNRLRMASRDGGFELERELKNIEQQLDHLIEELRKKRRERVLSWLDSEVPKKLESFRTNADMSLREELVMYRKIVEEHEIIKRIETIDVQLLIIDIERVKVENIKDAMDRIRHLKELGSNFDEVNKYIAFLESDVLAEWNAIDSGMAKLKANITKEQGNLDGLRACESDALVLSRRLATAKDNLAKLASEHAIAQLTAQVNQMVNSIREQIDRLNNPNASPRTQSQVTQTMSPRDNEERFFTKQSIQMRFNSGEHSHIETRTVEELYERHVVESVQQTKVALIETILKRRDSKAGTPEGQTVEERPQPAREQPVKVLVTSSETPQKMTVAREVSQTLPEAKRQALEKPIPKIVTTEPAESSPKLAVDVEAALRAEREAAERAAREAAEREARERAEREAREAAEREREARERAAREAAEREALEKAKREAEAREKAQREADEARDKALRDATAQKDVEKAEQARRVADIMDRLAQVQVWLKFNKISDFTANEMSAPNDATLERAFAKKAEYEAKRAELRDIYDLIKHGNVQEERPLELYSELVKEVDGADWDALIKAIQALLKINAWLAKATAIDKTIKERNEASSWNSRQIEQTLGDINESIKTAETLELEAVKTFFPVAEKVNGLKKSLEKSSTQLTKLKQGLSARDGLQGEFDKLADELIDWIAATEGSFSTSLQFKDADSMADVEQKLKDLATEIAIHAPRVARLNELGEKLALSHDDSDPQLSERGVQLAELNVKWQRIQNVCSRKSDSFETLREVFANATKRATELEALRADAEAVPQPARPTAISSQAKQLAADFRSLEAEILKKLPDTRELSETWPSNCGSRCKLLSSSAADLLARYKMFVKCRDELCDLLRSCEAANDATAEGVDKLNDLKKTEEKMAAINELLSTGEDGVQFIKLKDQLDFVAPDLSSEDKDDIEKRIAQINDTRNNLRGKLQSLKKETADKLATIAEQNQRLKRASQVLEDIDYTIVETSLFTADLEDKKHQQENAKSLKKRLSSVDIAKIGNVADDLKDDVAELAAR